MHKVVRTDFFDLFRNEKVKMPDVLRMLKGSDLRSIGRSETVVKLVLNEPTLTKSLVEGMFDQDPVVRARSSDALEKVARVHPEYVKSFKDRILYEASKISQQEVRWHVAQLVSYLELNKKESSYAANMLLSWINDKKTKSKIVKVFSLQALTDLSMKYEELHPIARKALSKALVASPSERSRAKKLIALLN